MKEASLLSWRLHERFVIVTPTYIVYSDLWGARFTENGCEKTAEMRPLTGSIAADRVRDATLTIFHFFFATIYFPDSLEGFEAGYVSLRISSERRRRFYQSDTILLI